MLLNVHSYYSLRYGTMSPEQLIRQFVLNGFDTAVLTDINNSSGVLDFVKECRKNGINGLAGMEFRTLDTLHFIGIAKNTEGFKELNDLQTAVNFKQIKLGKRAPFFKHVFIVYPYGAVATEELLPYEFTGIRADDLSKIIRCPKHYLKKYVLWHSVNFSGSENDFMLHRQLRAIDHNILISQLQPHQTANARETFVHKNELLHRYRMFPELIENTENLLAGCRFDFDFKKIKNKQNFTESREKDKALLYRYTMEGFLKRYNRHNEAAKERVLKELDIIEKLNFSSYFLITDDICRYARSKNYHYVGRGSGANSIVAYCLQITDVCPIELDLYFERFLNPKRLNPPDFDIDFSWTDRDDIYRYIFNRYPKGTVALMGAMTTFRSRSIIRELGKIYGLPKADIDRMVRDPGHILNKNEVCNMIQSVYGQMADFPNQRTLHASGLLISELPLTCYGALDLPPKGLPTIQFDMYVAEDIGFEKFDILSQRGIGHIKDCRELIRQNRGETVSTDDPKRFFDDPRIADQLKSANTIGCFYIESPAMRQLLTKLNCDNYLTLVAASSIIRPGVASSGMMQAFIERHRDPDKQTYLHPVFKEHLEETYGIMVYQEDVMKIGHYFGGLDLADADVLRRMMSGKYRNKNHLIEIEHKFFSHCANKGYSPETAAEVWRQMESFAGYSFNKAHSASYAVESYQSLYLKTYYPLEFMVSVLNNYGGFYNRKVYLNEARKAGGIIRLPCVNNSKPVTALYGNEVYLGFDCLLNFESRLTDTLIKERQQNGKYTGLENFMLRTNASLEQLVILIRCGAFGFLNTGKKELLWEAHLLASQYKKQPSTPLPLFEISNNKTSLPILESSLLEDLFDEIELIGFPVSDTMFHMAKSGYRGNANARDLFLMHGKTVRIVAELVTEKTVRTRNNKTMKFGTFLDVNGDFIDTVHFPPSLQNYPLTGSGLYLIEGDVVIDYGCPAVEVHRCARMPLKHDPRSE